MDFRRHRSIVLADCENKGRREEDTMTPEEELKSLGISCAMNFDKLSSAEKRIMLDFFKAQKRIEQINDETKKR